MRSSRSAGAGGARCLRTYGFRFSPRPPPAPADLEERIRALAEARVLHGLHELCEGLAAAHDLRLPVVDVNMFANRLDVVLEHLAPLGTLRCYVEHGAPPRPRS